MQYSAQRWVGGWGGQAPLPLPAAPKDPPAAVQCGAVWECRGVEKWIAQGGGKASNTQPIAPPCHAPQAACAGSAAPLASVAGRRAALLVRLRWRQLRASPVGWEGVGGWVGGCVCGCSAASSASRAPAACISCWGAGWGAQDTRGEYKLWGRREGHLLPCGRGCAGLRSAVQVG